MTKVLNGNIFNLTNLNFAISEQIESISMKITPLQEKINKGFKELESIQAYENKYLVFEGDVYLGNAKINSLTAISVNSQRFEPESYLLAGKKGQTLRDVKVKKTLEVDWLLVDKIGNKSVNGK